jgi:hypothetical protein
MLGLRPWQAVFFDARSPEAALREVHACLMRQNSPAMLLYPKYVTQELETLAKELGFLDVVGDAEQHELGPLSQAKGWLHPHINPEKRSSNLRDALPRDMAKGPVGYIASSGEELLQALRALQAELPGKRFVLKPSWGSGGIGIVLDVTEECLRSFSFPESVGYTAIVEELIEGLGERESPTLYMLGSEPCGLLGDRLLANGGTRSLGNRWPSAHSTERLTQQCVQAGKALQSIWNIRSNWGLDFVVNPEGEPVIVDINMGRPIGNFAVRLWESRFVQQLFLHTSTMDPLTAGCEEVFDALQTEGLLWEEAKLEGVVMYQYLSNQQSRYTIASATGWERVDALLERFQTLVGKLS